MFTRLLNYNLSLLFLENVENEGTQQDGGERIDLIKFYNTIFVQVVKDNALRYSSNNVNIN